MARGDRDPPELQAHQAVLVEKHLGFATQIARDEVARRGAARSLEDAVQDGREGLVFAAMRFDPAKGYKFKTYAETIIRGHIRDGAAKILEGWRSRTQRVALDEHVENLAGANGQHGHCAQNHLEAGVDMRRELAAARDLYQMWSSGDELEATDPGDVLVAHVQRAMASLSPVQRRIIEHHFFEGRKFCELTEELQLSTPHISHLKSKAIVRLRKYLTRNRTPR